MPLRRKKVPYTPPTSPPPAAPAAETIAEDLAYLDSVVAELVRRGWDVVATVRRAGKYPGPGQSRIAISSDTVDLELMDLIGGTLKGWVQNRKAEG